MVSFDERMFRLTKWYFDCVAEGECFLAYRAELAWRAVRLNYASVLGGRTSLRRTAAPRVSDDMLEWAAPALGLEARWDAIDPPAAASIFEGVDWRCRQPRARAEVRWGSRSLRGLGYAECLTLSVAPWRLAIDELRWGRFLSERDGLVWIDCRGEEPRQLMFHNGAPADASCLEELELEPGSVLRDGRLAETALSVIPKVETLFPARLLKARETKWLSRGCWRGVGGWAIHEVVRFR